MEKKSRYDISHLIGQKFNRWTVLRDLGTRGEKRKQQRYLLVRCECGTEKEIYMGSIKRGISKSCGCWNMEVLMKRLTTHGLRNHPLYTVWKQMRQRCLNKNATYYSYYGGRGVTICKEWLDGFQSFYDWAINNGWKHGLELDKDAKAPEQTGMIYCPEFCSFVEPCVNKRNMSTNRIIEYNGEKRCLSEWAEFYGVCRKRLSRRLDKGMPLDVAAKDASYSFYGYNGDNKKEVLIKSY